MTAKAFQNGLCMRDFMSFFVPPTPVVIIGLKLSKYNLVKKKKRSNVDFQKVMECEQQSLSKAIIDPSYRQRFRQIKNKIAGLERYKPMIVRAQQYFVSFGYNKNL